jgi:hypothetical protein
MGEGHPAAPRVHSQIRVIYVRFQKSKDPTWRITSCGTSFTRFCALHCVDVRLQDFLESPGLFAFNGECLKMSCKISAL